MDRLVLSDACLTQLLFRVLLRNQNTSTLPKAKAAFFSAFHGALPFVSSAEWDRLWHLRLQHLPPSILHLPPFFDVFRRHGDAVALRFLQLRELWESRNGGGSVVDDGTCSADLQDFFVLCDPNSTCLDITESRRLVSAIWFPKYLRDARWPSDFLAECTRIRAVAKEHGISLAHCPRRKYSDATLLEIPLNVDALIRFRTALTE